MTLLTGDNDAVFLPSVALNPLTVDRTFLRLRERASGTPMALFWLRLWARSTAFRRDWVLKEPALQERLAPYPLEDLDTAVVFWLAMTDYELGQLLLFHGTAQRPWIARAKLLRVRVHPQLFFPLTDHSGLDGSEQEQAYAEIFAALSTRLGMDASPLAQRFEAWVRQQPSPIVLGPAMARYFRTLGVEL